MPESIEHNASIIGRTLVHYHKFFLIKIHITEKDRYTLIEESENNRQLTVLLEYIDLFRDIDFDKQGVRVCASATYCFPIKCKFTGKNES